MERVLLRLGIPSRPAPNLEGLRMVYGAWCANVPFDNVRKMIAMRTGAGTPLPGGNAGDFFENLLSHGCGGTCWPTSNALYELLSWLGFEARRITGSMRDLGYANHASVNVRIEDRDWLVDSSMLTNSPLPLAQDIFISADPVVPAEIEPSNGTYVVWTKTPPSSSYLPCRMLGAVDHAFYLARYEESRARSPFNQRLYARRNHPGRLVVLLGHNLFISSGDGVEARDLSREGLCDALHEWVGINEGLVQQWARCGGLAASFEAPSGDKPPPVTLKPPSQRER